MEAVRSIRDQNFSNLTPGNFGLTANGQWALAPQSEVVGVFTRTISISDINSQTKQVISKVAWNQSGTPIDISFSTILTDWRTATSTGTSTEFCP
jgi:hypothetical protein